MFFMAEKLPARHRSDNEKRRVLGLATVNYPATTAGRTGFRLFNPLV